MLVVIFVNEIGIFYMSDVMVNYVYKLIDLKLILIYKDV